MPRFVVERTFPNGFASPAEDQRGRQDEKKIFEKEFFGLHIGLILPHLLCWKNRDLEVFHFQNTTYLKGHGNSLTRILSSNSSGCILDKCLSQQGS